LAGPRYDGDSAFQSCCHGVTPLARRSDPDENTEVGFPTAEDGVHDLSR
jgi:hypothetical protein